MSEEKEKPKPAYYSILPASVRYDKSLHPNAKILYSEITCLCQKEGYCWASNAYFSELFDVSDRSIINWINNLREKEYIKTQLIFKKGSKEIKERRIYISDPLILKNLRNTDSDSGENNFTTPGENEDLDPDEEKFTTGSEKKFTTPDEEKFRGGEKKFTHNNKPLSNLTSISSEEDAKKHFSDNDYKSNYKKWWLQKGEKEKLKYRPSSAKLWEEIFKEKNPDLYKTTLNSANSESTVAQSDPIKINNNDPLWLKLSEVLKSDFDKDIYETWLSKLNFVDVKDGNITLAAPSKFLRDWIKREHLESLKLSFQQAEESLKSINIIHV